MEWAMPLPSHQWDHGLSIARIRFCKELRAWDWSVRGMARLFNADGSWKYIFHAHWSKEKIHPRTSYFKDFAISDQGVVSISGEVIEPRVMK